MRGLGLPQSRCLCRLGVGESKAAAPCAQERCAGELGGVIGLNIPPWKGPLRIIGSSSWPGLLLGVSKPTWMRGWAPVRGPLPLGSAVPGELCAVRGFWGTEELLWGTWCKAATGCAAGQHIYWGVQVGWGLPSRL